MYPPTVPPSNVKIAGIKFEILSLGTKVSLTARPIGGLTIKITINITTIIHPPSTFVSISIAFVAFFNKNIVIATPPEIKYPAILGIPSKALKPNALPPTFPILNTSPPNATRNATKYPSPGSNLFATSCPRSSLTHKTRHTLSCTIIASKTDTNITNPKFAFTSFVNLAVCTKNPGPIADVAIINAAPSSTLLFFDFFSTLFLLIVFTTFTKIFPST